jgi:hypothetical protein
VSELRSVVEALRAESLGGLSDAAVEEDFAELHRACEQLEAERLRRLAEIERRGIFTRDGHLSCASWLVARFRMAWADARGTVRLARALEHMLATRRALDDGEISLGAARLLADAHEAHPEAFARAEERLVEAARIHTVGDLHRVAAFWRRRVEDLESVESGDDRRYDRRRLHASLTFAGMVRVDGDLDPETGESLLTALGAVLDAEMRSRTAEDTRSPAQRRADALGEICRQWLDRADRPEVAGERPHVTVTVGLDTLTGDAEGGAELDRTGPIATRVAQRFTCDASIRRVVLSARSEPLDVGRSTPVVPVAMRRAVVVRDRHCRFPGCDRPQAWCDAHHVVHWARGGPTSLENLVLLCRRHHRLVHRTGGFHLESIDGRSVFSRSDGSRLADRAPPGLPGV